MGLQCRIEHCRDIGHDVLDLIDTLVDHSTQSSLSHVNSRYVAPSQTDVCLGSSFTPSLLLAFVPIKSASASASCPSMIHHRLVSSDTLPIGKISRPRSAISEDVAREVRRCTQSPYHESPLYINTQCRQTEFGTTRHYPGSHDMHCRLVFCKLRYIM